MTLRPRIALVTIAVIVPMVAALVAWDTRSRRVAAERELEAFARGLLDSPEWRAGCGATDRRGPPPDTSDDAIGHAIDHAIPVMPPPPDVIDHVIGHAIPAMPPAPDAIGHAIDDAIPATPPSPDAINDRPRDRPPPPGSTDDATPVRDRRPPPPGGPRRPGPPRPRPHSRPATFHAYDATFTPHAPHAPALAPALRAAAAAPDAATDALPLPVPWQSPTVRVLLRVPGDDPRCAWILAEGTTEPWLGGVLPPTHIWLVPLLAVLAVVLLAIGPIVRRLRRLTHAVQRAADADYEHGVRTDGAPDDEIAALARAFDHAARAVRARLDETRRRETALRDFVANTTHDIMIPLTVLHGHLAALEGHADPAAVAHAMNEAHYLGALIHNLALTARLDAAAAIEPAPVALAALIERVVARHRPIARGLGVALDYAVPPAPITLDGDVTLLEQAVGNLVYNAIRYNRAGGHVAVTLDPDPAGFVLRVIDDGPGIADDELPRLLERGARGGEARTRAPGGSGLGLDITARVARLHHLALRFTRSAYGGLQVELSPRQPLDDPAPAV